MAFNYTPEEYERDCREHSMTPGPEISSGDFWFLAFVFFVSVVGFAPIGLWVAEPGRSPKAGLALWIALVVGHVAYYVRKIRRYARNH